MFTEALEMAIFPFDVARNDSFDFDCCCCVNVSWAIMNMQNDDEFSFNFMVCKRI